MTVRRSHLGVLRGAWILIGLSGIAASAIAQDQSKNPPAATPSALPPPPSQPSQPSQPTYTLPKVEQLKIERPRYNQYSGFTAPSGFTYQGPRYFSRPFNNGYFSNREIAGVPYYPPVKHEGSPTSTPTRMPVAPGVALSGTLTDAQRAAIAAAPRFHDPFAERYPYSDMTHSIVASDGKVRIFTTTSPALGFGQSFDSRRQAIWDLMRRQRAGRFRPNWYLHGYLRDPFNGLYYRPVEQIYLAPGVGSAEVFYGPTMTIQEYQAANSGIIPNSNPPAPAVAEPSSLDQAISALDAGRPDAAIPHLRDQLTVDPDAADIRRMLGLSLLMDKDIPQGIAEIAGAYAKDPGLAAAPIDIDRFKVRRASLTETTSRVIAYAKRNNAPMAYFAAAIIQQSRGETAIARKMLDMAVHSGLDAELASSMAGALAGPKH